MTPDIAALMKPDNSGTGSSAASARLAEDMDNFLTLLTTQLQNQDPTNPMDSKEMTNQLVQFSQVEQQIQQNKNLEQLLALQNHSATASAVSYIGRQVQMPGNASMLEDGGARFGYSLSEPAQSVSLMVLDSSGKAVFQTDGLSDAGRHTFTWNGQDTNGNAMAPGVYSLLVTANDRNGEPIIAETDARATVTGVVTGAQGPELMVGDLSVKMIDVRKIFAADAA